MDATYNEDADSDDSITLVKTVQKAQQKDKSESKRTKQKQKRQSRRKSKKKNDDQEIIKCIVLPLQIPYDVICVWIGSTQHALKYTISTLSERGLLCM